MIYMSVNTDHTLELCNQINFHYIGTTKIFLSHEVQLVIVPLYFVGFFNYCSNPCTFNFNLYINYK